MQSKTIPFERITSFEDGAMHFKIACTAADQRFEDRCPVERESLHGISRRVALHRATGERRGTRGKDRIVGDLFFYRSKPLSVTQFSRRLMDFCSSPRSIANSARPGLARHGHGGETRIERRHEAAGAAEPTEKEREPESFRTMVFHGVANSYRP